MTTRNQMLTAAMILTGTLLGACQPESAMGPTEPPPPPPPSTPVYNVSIRLDGITVSGTCEDVFTNFDGGEFSYAFSVSWPDGTTSTIAATNSYPSSSHYRHAKTGNRWTFTQPTASRMIESVAGVAVTMGFRATEWDWDLFGRPFADGSMNNLSQSHTFRYVNGNWESGSVALVLSRASGCRIVANVTGSAARM
jgi:hypothetical protein